MFFLIPNLFANGSDGVNVKVTKSTTIGFNGLKTNSLTADLSLVKSVNNNSPAQNSVITYTIVVSNAGPDPATDLEVTDVVPAGLTFVAGSMTGPGTYVNSNPGTTGLKWQHIVLTSGGSATLTFQATVTASSGTIVNFAQVTASAEADPDSQPNNGNSPTPAQDDESAVSITVILPVVLTCPTNTTTAACQTQTAVDAAFTTWLATASGTGGCNGVLTNNNTGAPSACGGATTVTFTYTSTCAPFTTTCSATFMVAAPSSPTPVFANCNNTINLGCNPGTLPSCSGIASGGFGGAVTASNSCGAVAVSCSAGTITVNGCARTQVFTFTATACGQTSTCTRTYNWTETSPPSFNGTCANGVINLGCNPMNLPACDPNITASNACGPVTVTCNVGSIIVNGCNRQQTLLYVANAPGCGNFSTCQRIFNWQVTTAPVFGNCDNTIDLGCNPATLPSCANINQTAFGGAITATNECGNVNMSCSAGTITSNGCNRTQVFTITATACGFTSTCTRTFTWTVATAPVFDNCTTSTTDLGCNPSTLPSCDASVTASNECGAVTVNCSAGTIASNGCNRTQIFTYTAAACGLTSTCTRTFTWQVGPVATLTCPTNTTVAACQTQVAVDAQFTAWLATASFTGGCGAVLTNNNTGAPTFCGGSTTVTFTLTSNCQPTQTCQATFTVTAAPPPQLTCPNPLIRPVCQTRAQDSIALANWYNTLSFSGGCNGVLSNNGFNGSPPSSCGGTKTLTLTYSSSCAAPLTCTSTFTIPAPTAPVLTCPTNQTEPFGQTQAQINAAFATWLATVSASGGCNGVLSNNNTGAPPATGGSTTVTFTYAQSPPSTPFFGACPFSTLTCQATFSVSAVPPVVLTCPTNTTAAACQTQAAVDAAFSAWLATASANGGCNGVLTNNNTGAPPACGGTATVTFTYTSTCAPLTTTCQATFTVAAPPPVTIICPTPTTVASCQTQAAIDAQFATWVTSLNGQGGCNAFGTDNSGGSAPSACGGSKTVTFTINSDCAPLQTNCTSTFTVSAPPPVTIICPTPTTVASCQTQAAIDAQYAAWVGTFNGQGGCNAFGTDNAGNAPSACGGSKTVTFTINSDCAPLQTNCTSTFTVAAPPPVTIICPTPTAVASCQTQAAVNAQYAAWVGTFNGQGGCNAFGTDNAGNAPSACGGSKTVTFTINSDCAPLQTNCTSTFTVTAPPPVVLNCPTNTTAAACQTQAAVNTAFATWLATASASGGCNGVLTNNNTGAPSACGGSTTVTFTYTSSCAPLTTTCQATFTVAAAPTVVLTCPTNTTAAACQTQAAVNTAFATWLATASASGGCNGVLTNNNTGAPSACGGSTTVTFTYTSSCAPTTTTCTATFTVPAAPTVVLTCPVNTTAAACQTQAAVNTAFATWLATASASGGCNGVLTNNNTGAPSACGGSTTVTFTYTSTCAPTTTTCTATFTVPAAPTVVLTCPVNTTTTACQTQAAVNAAFASWLATATASGGCNGVLTNNNTGAPSACGGSTTVTFTYTSTCAPTVTTCTATFTVPTAPTVVLTCPTNTTAAACQTQAAVNTAFAAWLATASASGGCNGVLTNNNTGAPSACGGSTTVTFTYTNTCAPTTTTCQATFTVASAPTVVLTCPTNMTTAACQTQAAVNAAFATWLATATASGGCNGVLTNNNTGAPSACGGSTTVTFTYTNTCAPTTTTCQATFTVASAPTVVLTCPTNTTAAACQTQAAVNTAFSAWLATASASGGCNGVLTNNNTGAPSACGGSTTVTFTYTSSCAPTTTTCQATFTVAAAPTIVLNCPAPATAGPCLTQAQLTAQYNAWLATATASGGCNGVLTNNAPAAPSICSLNGSTTTVTWTYTSSCAPLTTTCTSTFTLQPYPDFTLPANGASTVACPVNATQPTPPTVVDGCGKSLSPTGPVITNVPNPLTCEGTRTYAWTYTDCAGHVKTWSFVYTIERLPFTVPANGAATVACPALAVQPTPPVVTSNCGEVLTPTGPVITNNPNPLTCEGTRTYAWTYTDCEGNTATWSFIYIVERQPFSVPANGGSTVACPDQTDVQPTPPVVTSNCGEVLTPVVSSTAKPGCEGNRNWDFTYTDCEGNTATWTYIYTVEYLDFTVPASETASVDCPLNAVQPTPPVVIDNCGKTLNPTGPVISSTNNAQGCEGSRKYEWTYKDCEGNTHTWSKTFNFQYDADFFVYPDVEDHVACVIYMQTPVPPTVYDNCGNAIPVSAPTITEDISGCSGFRKYSFVYKNCGGFTKTWTYTYFADDNEPPVGTCPGGSLATSIDVTDLDCIEDVPCPDDYDFTDLKEEIIAIGGFYDICSGDDITIALDSWTALWECSDPDGDGNYTFGRTFYFSITDACGNSLPDLCAVTFSGPCVPMETFPQEAWGNEGGEPGSDVSATTTDLQLITTLLNQGQIKIGGSSRSWTFTDAQCLLNVMPGIGNPAVLGNCQQVNCTGGCNPAGPAGMKNRLAGNTIALLLNIRYNVQYNGLTDAQIRNQKLGCIDVDAKIRFCPAGGGSNNSNCKLRVVESNGTIHEFPYTIGGLIDLANLVLDGNLVMPSELLNSYAQAANATLEAVNNYWHEASSTVTCDPNAGAKADETVADKSGGKGGKQGTVDFDLSPNPASNEVYFHLPKLDESENVTFELYNSYGTKVLRKDYGRVSYVEDRVSLGSNVRSGLYFIHVKAGSARSVQRLYIIKD